MASRWDHVRAVVIAAHLTAVTLAAVPSSDTPAKVRQADVAPWLPVAKALHVASTTAELRTWVVGFATRFGHARAAVLTPFLPYYRLCGTQQRWLMFGSIDVDTARLEVDLHEDGVWTPLYVDGVGPRWRTGMMDEERIRTLRNTFAQGQDQRAWDRFVDWLAARAHEDHPSADMLRARYRHIRLPKPEAVDRSPTQKATYWEETRVLSGPP